MHGVGSHGLVIRRQNAGLSIVWTDCIAHAASHFSRKYASRGAFLAALVQSRGPFFAGTDPEIGWGRGTRDRLPSPLITH